MSYCIFKIVMSITMGKSKAHNICFKIMRKYLKCTYIYQSTLVQRLYYRWYIYFRDIFSQFLRLFLGLYFPHESIVHDNLNFCYYANAIFFFPFHFYISVYNKKLNFYWILQHILYTRSSLIWVRPYKTWN